MKIEDLSSNPPKVTVEHNAVVTVKQGNATVKGNYETFRLSPDQKIIVRIGDSKHPKYGLLEALDPEDVELGEEHPKGKAKSA